MDRGAEQPTPCRREASGLPALLRKALQAGLADGPSRTDIPLAGSQCHDLSWWRRCRQSDRTDAVLERRVTDSYDQLIGRRAISLYYYRAVFALGGIEQRSQLFQADLLIAKIDGRDCPASDADNLLVDLRTKGKA